MNPEYDFDSCDKQELIAIIDYLQTKCERLEIELNELQGRIEGLEK